MKMVCKNCKKLRKEIKMMGKLECIAMVYDWDLDMVYKDILEGTENGQKIAGGRPDLEFAEWFAKRYGVETDIYDNEIKTP